MIFQYIQTRKLCKFGGSSTWRPLFHCLAHAFAYMNNLPTLTLNSSYRKALLSTPYSSQVTNTVVCVCLCRNCLHNVICHRRDSNSVSLIKILGFKPQDCSDLIYSCCKIKPFLLDNRVYWYKYQNDWVFCQIYFWSDGIISMWYI